MDIATFIGLIAGSLLIVVAIVTNGSLADFIDASSFMVTVGGTVCALFINFPLRHVLNTMSVMKNCFLTRLPNPGELIQQMYDLATIARRDGLLALEERLATFNDPFLVRGLEMVIDGTPKEKLEEALTLEWQGIQERHTIGKKIFEQLGALAPAFGMIGTLIGLIQMLRTLDDPSKIGVGMAVAMITTFYGSVMANLLFLPLAGKLDVRGREEDQIRQLMIVGLAALVEGESPRAVESKLVAFLAPKQRPKKEKE